ncbi:metal ABC transporter solute-binding protein, Zn/Mn family [Cyanobium sp. CH-040]|uniref:metal ABC transporter solute-binding protein, Zn/Mn family n=1 Tax=Cyanobium sp. CH-040 TaxID=2823708 RepID=UPI0020CC2DFA|nr:zinc ABC transporter substrate-binding protein [Cyanobium sp. CH-040]MCP9928868.1 zinc ABC transporter substrate-binding protein [Cyanobium sp. CH-040]
MPSAFPSRLRGAPRRLLAAVSALGLLLAACGPPNGPGARDRPDAQASGDLKVVTTFLPITLFTRAVAGDCAEVTSLIPPGTGPHDFQSRPGDLVALRQARVLVKNGLEMEDFLDKLVAAAENAELTVIDSSRGVATIAGDDGGHDHGDSHAHGHSHGPVNPHIWLDPRRAVQQVETIRDGLVEVDPGCADGYRRNAEAYIAELRELDASLARELEPFRGKTFVAFHDVAPYFAERYGLQAEFVVDVPAVNPTPVDLRRVSEIVANSELRVLLSEPQQGTRSFNALASDLGVRISTFDPLETGSEQDALDPATYLRVMRRNGEALRQAFGA